MVSLSRKCIQLSCIRTWRSVVVFYPPLKYTWLLMFFWLCVLNKNNQACWTYRKQRHLSPIFWNAFLKYLGFPGWLGGVLTLCVVKLGPFSQRRTWLHASQFITFEIIIGTVTKYTNCSLIWYLNGAHILKGTVSHASRVEGIAIVPNFFACSCISPGDLI